MPAAVRFTVNTITPELKAAQQRARNLKPALQIFGQRMLRSVDENFRRRGRRDGRPNAWPKLSAVTIAMRPKGKGGKRARPLVLTGRLRASTTVSVSKNTLKVGSNVKYANDHHQDGAWGSSITKRERKEIKAHQREVFLDPTTGRGGRGRGGRGGRGSLRASRGKTRGAAAKRRRDGIRLGTVVKNQFAVIRRRLRRARGQAPRAGLVKGKVQVRAHVQNRVSRIPARPIYVFQPTDLAAWNKLYRNWVIRGTLRRVA